MPHSNFENSAMKTSFSLSSLPVSQTPDRNSTKPREFSSLKKKRRETTKRYSWGSTASEQKDDFWSSLESNYNYIMDNQLIDNCQDANCELSTNSMWSPNEFFAQFSELYSWLNRILEKVYGHEETIVDVKLRARCSRKILKKRQFFNIFNDQGDQLVEKYPNLKEEVMWRINHLNSMWDTLEPLLNPQDLEKNETTLDIDREVKCLKKWIRDMESRLQPLSFQKRWTKSEIETKAIEHKVLHTDIENHGKIVNSVIKLCKQVQNTCRATLKIASGLERRWHLLFLRSMEWQCYIENYIKKNNVLSSDSDSDDGPAKKQPRLSNGSPTLEDATSSDAPPIDDEISDKVDGNEMNAKELVMTPVTGEDSQFTKSNRNAPNLGTYYFKHIDTDSDMEKVEKPQDNTVATQEVEVHTTTSETSEEEWTYSANKEEPQKPSQKTLDIRKIVEEVEEMVSPIKRSNPVVEPPINKNKRVQQWLKIERPEDSCDASSEDEENESESSEELNESIATCRPQTSLNTSYIDLDLAVPSPKVALRQKHTPKGMNKGQRPSSIACITQLSKSSNRIDDRQPYSISESAIHKLSLTMKINEPIAIQGNNSTSSTVEDSCAMHNEEHNSPLRKKRFKLKKKAMLRKMDPSSPYNGTLPREQRTGALVKSGSFSGRECPPTTCERHTASDPSAVPTSYGIETSTTSGADSDDDKRVKRIPIFKIGARTSYCLDGLRDNSPGKFSLNTNEEQSSSLCDEAWDSYQEKYSSEAYSEAHDSDAARRVWEFGEDYHRFLGSQSDYSTQSSHLDFSPQFPRKAFLPMKIIDSDNEANDLRQLLKSSRSQLDYTEDVFQKQFAMGMATYLVNNDIDELVATCDRHLNCLTSVEKSPEEYKLVSSENKEFSDLIVRWQNLKGRINKMQEYRRLQNDILQLKRQLCDIKIPVPSQPFMVETIEDLSRDIDYYSAEVAYIEEHKKRLQGVNVDVNHFVTQHSEYAPSSLKSDVSELYRIWNEINNSATEGVKRLNVLLQNWQVLEIRLDQLRGDLRDDEQTLGVLDSALQGGTFSNQMASSVRGVAKLLSESKAEQGCSFPEIVFEGSFSDSGISDEGSEHDLGERERRLSAIRRLVKQLETVMAPDCVARIRMRERLVAAEEELRNLQNRCRSIIVRTAVTATAPMSDSAVAASPGGQPDDEPNRRPWFKRVLRASLSFQLAIMALLFVACLLEPQCCDNINNLHLSINPQLHYVRGPPPI